MNEKITAALLAIALVTSVAFVGLAGPAAAQTGYAVDIDGSDALFSSNGDTIQGSDVEVFVGGETAIDDSNVTVVDPATSTTYVDGATEFDEVYIAGIPTDDIGTAVGDSLTLDVMIDGQLEQTVTVSIASASVTEVDNVLSDDLSSATSIEVTYQTADVVESPLMDEMGSGQYEAEIQFGEEFIAVGEIDTSTAGDTVVVDYVTESVYDEIDGLPAGVTDTLYADDSATVVSIHGTEVYNDGSLASDYTTTIAAPEIVDLSDPTVPITVTTTGQAVSDGTITAADVGLEDGTGTTFTETSSDVTYDTITVDYDVDTTAIGSAIGDSSMFYASVDGATELSTTVELTDTTEINVDVDPTHTHDLNDSLANTIVDITAWGATVEAGQVSAADFVAVGPFGDLPVEYVNDYSTGSDGEVWVAPEDVGTVEGDMATFDLVYQPLDLTVGSFTVELVDSSTTTNDDGTTTATEDSPTGNYTVDVTYEDEIDDTVNTTNVTIAVNGTDVADGLVTTDMIALEAANSTTVYNATATDTSATDEIVVDYTIPASDVGTIDGDVLELKAIVDGTVERSIAIQYYESVLGGTTGSSSNQLLILVGLLAVGGGGLLVARD
jgi:hypothetical protein